MPFSFTNPLGVLAEGLGSGLESIGGLFEDVLSVGGGLFEAATPILGGLQQFGVIPQAGPGGGVSPTRPPTSPSPGLLQPQGPGAGNAPGFLERNLPLLDPGRQFLPDFLGGAPGTGAAPMAGNGLCIQPVRSPAMRFPRTVQTLVTTPSGNTRVVTYRNMGSPILYSGDLAAKKRVNRVRRKLGGR